MANPSPVYQRLTRNAAGVGTYASFWLAPDHGMIVRSSGYHESYVRLQLSDMKAIFLTQTDRRLWWGIVWGVVAGWSGIVLATEKLPATRAQRAGSGSPRSAARVR